MKKLAFLFAYVAIFFTLQAKNAETASFNDNWRFMLGDDQAYSDPNYNDSQWRQLDLPHDWAIEGDFSILNPSGTGGGALPGGIGWYRKTFDIDASGDKVYIDFDGVYMNGTVYVNGHELGTRPYGYASFSYDITPYLKIKDNVIAVRVDNAEQPNSRWYSGCGIYRNVWLRKLNPLHVVKDGVFVTTTLNPERNHAKVRASVEIENPQGGSDFKAVAQIIAPDGSITAVAEPDVKMQEDKCEIIYEFDIDKPELWSVDTPNLYTFRHQISKGSKDQIVDIDNTIFGIRDFEFDPERGFSLNGVPMKINGVCMHHDMGALGAAVNTRAIERQLQIMKEMGANGYRCSHNPPAPEVLDLCDRLGILVMDETFDMWRKRKTSHDYSRYFDEWHERDLTDMVRRDRNHPSIIIWSIGNEVLEQWSDAQADTLSLDEANLILNFGHSADMLLPDGAAPSVNSLLTIKLADMTRALDPTRPITSGCNEPAPGNHLFRSGALDIIGYNYHVKNMPDVPKNFPGKPFIITESNSALMTRGYYLMPSDSLFLAPVRWDRPFYDPSYACSSYDNYHAPWGERHEETLDFVNKNDFVSGQFIWTGFDYIGEPTPYGWPARSSYFGIVDLAGIPKDVYYMYQSEWRPDKTVLHLFPHWNWKDGQEIDMWAYYNNADEVELFINGVSQGVKSKADGEYHVMWRVVYQPGEVKAVSRKDGKTIAEQTIATAGNPYAVRLTPDRNEIDADGRDLSYVLVEIVDKDGNLCPWAANEVVFSVEGSGFNAGVDNGSSISLERFKDDKRQAFYGKAMLIVQNDKTAGDVTVTATSPGLKSDRIALRSLPLAAAK